MSGDYTTTPNLGLFKPNYDMDDGQWGSHLNTNADVLDSAIHGLASGYLPLTGGTVSAPAGATALTVNASNSNTAADHAYNIVTSTVNYTADATGGDNLAFSSYMVMRPNGHQVMLSGHTSGLYGNAYLDNDGNAASHCAQLNGVMAISGNGGPGTLDKGVDVLGHANFNTGGGHLTNHYFLYQEPSHAATNEYGAYFSAPVAIGTDAPTYLFQINPAGVTGPSVNNWMLVGQGYVGQLTVTSNGAYIYPGYNPGPGGFGCTDLVVGFNGQPNALNASSNFLYISACPGPPSGGPVHASPGTVAVTYDTTTHKLWLHDGTVWRGVVLT